MIAQIKKILFATDLSAQARKAFGYAISLADRFQAGLVILHVMEETSRNGLSKAVLGSVTHGVLRQGRFPVLLVNLEK